MALFSSMLINVNDICEKKTKKAEVVARSLYALKERVTTCKCHFTMVEPLFQKVKKGAIKNLYIPMPSNCVEDYDAKEPTY